MPTIEVCAVGQETPIPFASDAFVIEAETNLVSHRSLFRGDLAKLRGCIYHLANKDHQSGDIFFGGALLTEARFEEAGHLEFLPDVRAAVAALMEAAAADTNYFLLLTDYQFGPMPPVRASFKSRAEFWRAHDERRLRINGLYSIAKDV